MMNFYIFLIKWLENPYNSEMKYKSEKNAQHLSVLFIDLEFLFDCLKHLFFNSSFNFDLVFVFTLSYEIFSIQFFSLFCC